jgi:hypothetical protein
MLRSMKDLENYTLSATDGQIGHLKDIYFDDDAWVVRYLVVEAGSWLTSRKVLISPISVHHPNWRDRTVTVSITKDQVKNSPDIDIDKPVSRQNEQDYLGYYGYGNYWGGDGMWGAGLYPYAMAPGYPGYGVDRLDRAEREHEEIAFLRAEKARHKHDNPHLRSCQAVNGYHIHATDGEIGHVAGYLIDDETWAIRYLIVDTSNWWLGHRVLIAPEWIGGVHWKNETVSVSLTREAIKNAPAYDSSIEWSHKHDLELYQHYGRTGYWSDRATFETEV